MGDGVSMSDSGWCVSGRTKVLAVFGCPVEHSLSPAMHNAAIRALSLDYVYVPFRVEPDELPQAVAGLRSMRFAGVNLTIPLKERAVELVDEISDEAARIGAVNTLRFREGRLVGDSTDGPGFLRSLDSAVEHIPESALVLGAGGSARAVCHALADRGVRVAIANRTPARAEVLAAELPGDDIRVVPWTDDDLASACAGAGLVVNCTSVGMTPNIGDSPLPPGCVRAGQLIYDLIYNPSETRLLKEARESGALAMNGVLMLVHQGACSFELWTGVKPPTDVMERAVNERISGLGG